MKQFISISTIHNNIVLFVCIIGSLFVIRSIISNRKETNRIIRTIKFLTGIGLAFFLVAMTFLVLLIMVYTYRKPWIERPLVKFLADTLLN